MDPRRRRRGARRRHERQRRLRLPRRRPAHAADDVPRMPPSGVSSSAPRSPTATSPASVGVSSTSRRTSSRPTSSTSSAPCRPWPASPGTRVAYVKPHGALYNAVVHHEAQAQAVVDAVVAVDTLAAGPRACPGSVVLELATAAGLRAVTEAFADRAYTPDGRLVPRTEPGAVLHDPDEVAARVVRLALDGVVTAVDGTDVEVRGGVGVHPRRHPRGGRHGARGAARARGRRRRDPSLRGLIGADCGGGRLLPMGRCCPARRGGRHRRRARPARPPGAAGRASAGVPGWPSTTSSSGLAPLLVVLRDGAAPRTTSVGRASTLAAAAVDDAAPGGGRGRRRGRPCATTGPTSTRSAG